MTGHRITPGAPELELLAVIHGGPEHAEFAVIHDPSSPPLLTHGGSPAAAAQPLRPRAEDCDRLTAASLRPQVPAGAPSHCLPDGTALALRWAPVRGCYGTQEGQALLIACPCCSRPARVLWCPPGTGWGCWRCRPVSHRSHRRPGGRRHRRKPPAWHLERICSEQDQVAELLGLAPTGRRGWRPQRLLWQLIDIQTAERRPDAPRISARRRDALERRIDALETMRMLTALATCPVQLVGPSETTPKLMKAYAHLELEETAWAMRRPARDPRSPRT